MRSEKAARCLVVVAAIGSFVGCSALLGIEELPDVEPGGAADAATKDGTSTNEEGGADGEGGALDAGDAAADAADAAPFDAAIAQDLAGYWPFDGNGDDLSGNNRHLTVIGPVYAAGVRGQALAFNGDGSRYAVRSGDDEVFDFAATEFTIQIWATFPAVKVDVVLVEKFGGGGGWTFLKQGVVDDHVQWFWGAPIDSPEVTITPNQWHHFVVRRLGGGYSVYFDTTLVAVANDPNPILNSTAPLLVGRRNATAGQPIFMKGKLDELAIWTRSLSEVEIASLYNGGQGARLK